MKILPIINSKSTINFGNGTTPFKKITLKTAERLYSANFVMPEKSPESLFYPAFVFNNDTYELVKIFVKPRCIEPDNEIFELYRASNDGKLNLIGSRFYNIDLENGIINKGYMEARQSIRKLAALGVLLHQLTYERLRMLGLDNIKLLSTDKARNFHKKCGFDEIVENGKYEGYMTLSKEAKEDWDKISLKHPIFLGKDFPKELAYQREY